MQTLRCRSVLVAFGLAGWLGGWLGGCSFSIPLSAEEGGAPPAPADLQGQGVDVRLDNPYDKDGAMAPSPRCERLTRPPADEKVRIPTPDGRTRVADVHVPKGYDPTVPMPLVLNLHGFMSNPWQQELLSDMKERSESRNFLLVYPQGSGEGIEPYSWNAGGCCPPAIDKRVDDVGFLRLLLDRLNQTLCIDPRRIYATGMSNGGFMSHRMACEMSDRIAAVAPVAGQNMVSPCNPKRPVPVMHFHGTKDTIVPYNGGAPIGIPGTLVFPSVQTTINGWVLRNGCRVDKRTILTLPDSRCEAYESCRNDATVTLCTVDGGGHSWPGGSRIIDLVVGYTSPHLKATDLMLDFFFAHPMPL